MRNGASGSVSGRSGRGKFSCFSLASQNPVEFHLGFLGLAKYAIKRLRCLNLLIAMRHLGSGFDSTSRVITSPCFVLLAANKHKAITGEYRPNFVAAWRHLSL
jgi:hypothetical protein